MDTVGLKHVPCPTLSNPVHKGASEFREVAHRTF